MSAAVALLLLAWPSAPQARKGAYAESAHGSAARGVQRVPGEKRGACAQCHSSPGRERDKGRGRKGLFAANDNALCYSCHRTSDPQRGFATAATYARSSHGSSSAMVWPGSQPPARTSADAGLCVNCHDPHGVKDARGLVPSMLAVRGDALCLRCHDGSRATIDIASEVAKPFRHARDADGVTPMRCTDCHDVHRARGRAERRDAPAAPAALAGARRVKITNGPAGSSPLLEEAERDGGPFATEYEVCLRCHSGVGTTPGRRDIGMLVNPENRSFHPVEAMGRNSSIDPAAFARTWRWDRLVRCSDCHGSDDPVQRGPHGSRNAYLLKKPYSTASRGVTTAEGDLCFECHTYRTYAVPGRENAASRYPGHASHIARGIGCHACHDSHGSPAQPALVAVRTGELASYVQDAAGGSCVTSCHTTTSASAAYVVSYPR